MFSYNLSHLFLFPQKFFQIWISKKIYEKRKKNKLEKKKVDLFLETQTIKAKCLQIFFVLSIFLAPLSTSTTSLQISLQFLHKTFFNIILETKNDYNLLVENENKELLQCLLPSKALSPHFMKWHFTFCLRANILMICIFLHCLTLVISHLNSY